MAFNGSGVFNRLYNWVTDRDNSINIDATRMDAEMDGMATGLSTCIARDGQSTISADIPFNNNKITGLKDATAATDALNRQTADARYYQIGSKASKTSSDTPYTDVDGMFDIVSWDTSGGACTHNLAAAATAGDGYMRLIYLATAGNDLTIDGNSTETIDGSTTHVLSTAGEYVLLRCDGSNWDIISSNAVELSLDASPQLGGVLEPNSNTIGWGKGADIASADPLVIGTDGNFFDVTGTTGIASMTIAAHRKFTLQFDAAVTLTHGASLVLPGAADFTTEAGDVLEFQSTAANTVICTGTALADGLSPASAAAYFHIQDQQAGDGGTTTGTTWTTRPLNTSVSNTITGASIATNVITLPAGTYKLVGYSCLYQCGLSQIRLRNTSDAATTLLGSITEMGSGSQTEHVHCQIQGMFTLAASKNLELQYYVATAQTNDGLGADANTGENNVFADVLIEKVS